MQPSRAFGHPLWTVEDTRNRIRVSLRESFPVMFGPQWEHARDIFHDASRASICDHVTPNAGALEASGGGDGWPQGVVSNKAGAFLRAEVTHLGWGRYFGSVVGAGDAEADKPDPAPIHLALAAARPPRRCLGLVHGRHRARHAGGPRRRGDGGADRQRRT